VVAKKKKKELSFKYNYSQTYSEILKLEKVIKSWKNLTLTPLFVIVFVITLLNFKISQSIPLVLERPGGTSVFIQRFPPN